MASLDLTRDPWTFSGSLAFLNIDDGSLRQTPWSDYAPNALAYAPDARTLYTVGAVGDAEVAEVSLFAAHDASTGDVLWTVTVSGWDDLAVSADGSVAMTGRDKIDLTTHSVVSFDPCDETSNHDVWDVALTPDGSTAWLVCGRSGFGSQLRAYDVATLSLVDTIEFSAFVGGGIAITPDGSTAMLSPLYGWYVLRVDLATGAVADLATDLLLSGSVSISPDGTHAYFASSRVFDVSGALHAVDIATMSITASGRLVNYGTDPIVSPDGDHVFAVGREEWDTIEGISTHDAATLTPLSHTPLDDALSFRLTVTPDQAPVARLTASEPNSPVTFDASASTVEFGSIAEYAWDFGDGVSTVTTTPTVEHEYAEPGEYTATVRLTSSGGTSTEDVYTGHQLLRNGDASAVATVTVAVPEPAVPEPAVPGSGVAGELPPAGFNGATWVIAGIGMLLTGALAVVIVRRRVQPQRKDA
ncbi:PKD domain-containing protein [Agromyces larvae]|uniref:PKD domain-containing protein n=1 Tax=Agromyces larvae TaxID=2929802 RepID=A0ABY4BVA9_9MICO|nr:PKD domain-containing protein [Agromyces larvae]UOE43114.1 PKD domain-containing protein [Agromyces larvae]